MWVPGRQSYRSGFGASVVRNSIEQSGSERSPASDRRGAKLPIESIDVLLRGVRAIQSRVRAFGEGKAVPLPDADLLHALDALDTEHGSELEELPLLELEPSLAAKLGALELEQLKTGLNDGQRALRVDFKPSLERSARGLTINQVREQLQRIGDVVKVFPTSQPAGPNEPGGLSFVIVLLSPAPLKAEVRVFCWSIV